MPTTHRLRAALGALALHLAVFALIVAVFGGPALADQPGKALQVIPNHGVPQDATFSWVYLFGSLGAVAEKYALGALKHWLRGEFNIGDLVWTLFISLFAVPLVLFFVIPELGPPSGKSFRDAANAFLVTYNLFDVMNDIIEIKIAGEESRKLRAEKRRSSAPAPPPPAPAP